LVDVVSRCSYRSHCWRTSSKVADPPRQAAAAINPAKGGTGRGSFRAENTNPIRKPPVRVEVKMPMDMTHEYLRAS